MPARLLALLTMCAIALFGLGALTVLFAPGIWKLVAIVVILLTLFGMSIVLGINQRRSSGGDH